MSKEYIIVLVTETLVVAGLGSLLHFVYAWSGRNKFWAIFAAVNESTWEHIKLALSAIFACTLVDVWFLGDNANYWLAKTASFLVPLLVIPAIFYTYTHFTKCPILVVDISSFVVAAFLSVLTFVGVLQLPPISGVNEIICVVVSMVVLAMYFSFTKFPPHMFLFEDPITHLYGVEQRKQRRSTRRKIVKNK